MARKKTASRYLIEYPVSQFRGLFTQLEDQSIPDGSASESNNWITFPDHVELRGGQALMGANIDGVGRVSGLFVGKQFDGTQRPIMTYGTKIRYYSEDDALWHESTTPDMIPASASDDDISIDQYYSLAGSFLYLSSKNSSIYKISIPNPADVVDQASTTFRGKIKASKGSMYLWDNKTSVGGQDTTALFRSYIDKDELSDYTSVTAETGFAGAVDGVNKDYMVTLAFKGAGSKRTCMYITVRGTTASGVETFFDDRNGNLSSSAGGTGTINYATGAISVTFGNAPNSGSIEADYYWEDATSQGPIDFTKSTPRTAGQGFRLPQDDNGGDLQAVPIFGDSAYPMHQYKTWKFSMSQDDVTPSNDIYREEAGIPNHRAQVVTDKGIYYIDARDVNNPSFRLFTYTDFNPELQSRNLSKQLNLKNYRFDKGVVYEWEDYILFWGRHKDETENNVCFMYNRRDSTDTYYEWDQIDARASVAATYNGGLIIGDSASNNVFALFSGLTDDDINIPNSRVTNKYLVGMEGTKYFNIFSVEGLIDPDQELEVYFSYDQGPFVLIETISGQADYVDRGQSVTIGSATCGSQEIGGGSSGVEANPYQYEFRVNTPIFEYLRVKFVATKVGYVSVSKYNHKDIRQKSRRVGAQYSFT